MSSNEPQRPGDGIERYGYTQELRRTLSFTDLLVYGLIFMVPIAPFGIFGSVFQVSGGMVALAYAIGMLAMAFTAASYSQMSLAFPMAGSVYTYAGRGIHQSVGFLAGWLILLDYILVPGLLYLIASIAMNSLVPGIPVWIWLFGFVVLNTLVNYLGIEMTAKVNRYMLVAELIVLAIFIVIGIVALIQGKGRGFDFTPLFNKATFSWGLVFGSVSIAVLSFLGFDGISTLSEEAENPRRNILLATVLTCAVIGVLSAFEVYAAQLVWPASQPFPDETTAFVWAAGRTWAPLFAIVGFTLVVANFGSGMGAQLGAVSGATRISPSRTSLIWSGPKMTRAGPSSTPGEAAMPLSVPSSLAPPPSQLAIESDVMPQSMIVNGSVTTSGGTPRAGDGFQVLSASTMPLRLATIGGQ